jgi:hypothetical protein
MSSNTSHAITSPISPNTDLYIPVSIVASSAITIGVAVFAGKWMFGQVVKNWEEKLSLLSRQIEALSVKEEELKERIAAVDRKVVADCLSREEWIRDTVKTQTQIERLEARMVSQFDRIMDRIGGSNVTK